MPKYRITGPDGGTYEINAPEGATEAQVLEFAKQNYSAAKPKQRITTEEARDLSRIPAERYRAAGIEPPGRPDGSSGSWYQDYLAGVGKSFADTGRGVAQYLVDATAGRGAPVSGLDAAAGLVGMIPGVRDAAVRQSDKMRADEAERRRLLPSFTENPAFTAGNVIGTLGQLVVPGAVARGTAAAPALLPTTVRGNALQGALLGAAQPVATQGERGTNTLVGALGGATGAAVPKVAGGTANAFRNQLSGLSAPERAAASQIRQVASDPAALMVPQPSMVPGVTRTVAQETGDRGVAALERVARNQNPGLFAPIDAQNNAARVAILERMAGTDADLAAAEAARDASAGALRDQAFSEADTTAAQLLRGQALALGVPLPETNLQGQVAAIARQNASRPSVQSAINDVSRALSASDGSAASLYNVRQYISDLLSGKAGGEKSYAQAASRELMGIRDMLDAELQRMAPTFPAYLDAYRQGSLPINRMEFGRQLLGQTSAANPADTVGTPLLQAAPFGRAMRDLDAVAARATGFSKAKAEDFLAPSDLSDLRAIADDMDRIALTQRNVSSNSATQGNQYLSDQIANEAAREAAKQLPFGLGALTYFQNKAAAQTQEKMAYLLANPEELRRVLAALPAKDRAAVNKVLLQLSARTGASAPALAE